MPTTKRNHSSWLLLAGSCIALLALGIPVACQPEPPPPSPPPRQPLSKHAQLWPAKKPKRLPQLWPSRHQRLRTPHKRPPTRPTHRATTLGQRAIKRINERPPSLGDAAPYTVRKARIPRHLRGRGFGRAKYVLLLSIDGVSYDMLKQHLHRLPHLRSLVKAGFWRPALSVFPSVTWSAHATFVTGQYPRRHGVIGNRWLENFIDLIYPYQRDLVEPQRRKRTPSLYDLAHAKGWPTAALNWPSTQNATSITYNLPEIMYSEHLAYRYTSKPLRKVLKQMYRKTFRQPWSFDDFKTFYNRLANSEKVETDMFIRDLTIALLSPRKKRDIPRLMMAHFLTPDSWMHKYGPAPWVQRWSLEQADTHLGHIIRAYRRAGIWRQTAAFVTSDHGFSLVRYAIDLRLLLIKQGYSRYRSLSRRHRKREKVMVFYNSQSAFLYLHPSQKSKLPTLVNLLKSDPYKACIQSVFLPEAYRKMGLPIPTRKDNEATDPGKHKGAPDLLILAQPTCLFRRGHRRKIIKDLKKIYGSHGHLPTQRPLWSFLIGKGPGVRKHPKRALSKTNIVNIAPTIAHLMGLKWPRRWPSPKDKRLKMDGRTLRDILIKR